MRRDADTLHPMHAGVHSPRPSRDAEVRRIREKMLSLVRSHDAREDRLCRALRALLEHPDDPYARQEAQAALDQADPCRLTDMSAEEPTHGP